MTLRHNLVLLLITAAVCAYIGLLERPFQADEPAATDRRLFAGLPVAAVNAVELRRGDQSIRISRQDQGWRIEHPIAYPASPTRVEAFLKDLAELSYQTQLHPNSRSPQAEDPYGLDNPLGEIKVESQDHTHWVQLGKTAPGKMTFAQASNHEGILAISKEVLDASDLVIDSWRDRRVFPYPTHSIRQVHVSGTDSQIELQKREADQSWEMIPPRSKARLDHPFITFFLQQLSTLQIESFVDPHDAPPVISIHLGLESNQSFTLHLQNVDPADPNHCFGWIEQPKTGLRLPKSFADSLLNPETAFRDPYLLTPGLPFDTIEFAGDERFTLAKDQQQGHWWLLEPTRQRADDQLVLQLQKHLAELRITDFVADAFETGAELNQAEFGIDFPFRTLSLSRSQSLPPEQAVASKLTLRFGFKVQNHFLTHRSDEPSIYAIPFGTVQQIPGHAYQYRTRRLWALDPKTIHRMAVETTESPEIAWNRREQQWHRDREPLSAVESAACDRLVAAVVQSEAIAWTDRGDDVGPRYGIGTKGILTLQSGSGTSSQEIKLQFGSLSPRGNRYAATDLDGLQTVFEFPGRLFVELNRMLNLFSKDPLDE